MKRPITDAELKALKALHVWLHRGNGFDCDLIEECEDFHEEWGHKCADLRGTRGVEWTEPGDALDPEREAIVICLDERRPS